MSPSGHYWELTDILLSKLNDNKNDLYVDYMIANPKTAKRRGINVQNIKMLNQYVQ